MNPKRTWFVFLTAFFIISAMAVGAVFFNRGYRPDFNKGTLLSTGILAATSVPRAASVYVDDKLITATDDNLNLPPGSYSVKIIKDGYLPWQKEVTIQKEVVFLTDASLFRAAPDLRPITTTGASNPSLSPDGSKLVYAVTTASE